jgi:signal transduction histidine kinase
MTAAGSRRLANAIFAFVVLELVATVALEAFAGWSASLGDLAFLATFVLFPVIGLVLARRLPGNALGWLLLAIGVFAFPPAESYARYALAEGLPGGFEALAATSWTWVPTIGLAGTFALLLFPDGHLPSPRWRWFARVVGAGMVLTSIGILLGPGTLADFGYPKVQNPLAIDALEPFFEVALVGLLVIPAGIFGSAISLVVRFRRGTPTERLQIRWLASAAVVVAVVYAITMVASLTTEAGWGVGGGWISALQTFSIVLFALLPISIGVAVLRYRLYDIDVVIRKTVIVAAIAVFFTAVYAAVVGGIGALVEAHSTPVLSFAAAAIVAALFQPVLGWSRRIADRVVYGTRATPYEVLTEFSERVGAAYAAEDVLPRMGRVVAEGVGATVARVWVARDGVLRVAATWPSDASRPAPVEMSDATLPSLPESDAAFPIEHRGDLLGALAVEMPAADPMNEAKSTLIAHLAGQAGLVLRNSGLTEELRQRLDDLRAAQKRLVTAQDAERRRLERNIHDGAQQQLVALSVKLRLAEGLVERDPDKAMSMLHDLQGETQTALEDLRDLARGIYPPLLADKGLAAALEAQARKSSVPVAVVPDGVGRYPPEVEAAVYFSVLEALQNVAKYAEAPSARVELRTEDEHLAFEVVDDGKGFEPGSVGYGTGLQGIADRLAALDGALEVRSAPGAGTTVIGRIPIATGGAG